VFATESEFVRWLQKQSAGRAKGLRLGIGDDAALIEAGRGRELILTADLTIEGVHFLPGIHPPRAVGHRALARSLSDIAAMGGTPRYALISLAISPRTTRAWLKEFYAGVFALARRFAVMVVGGDTAVVSGATSVDAMVVGEIPSGKAILRSGARPGDQLFVSGRLGLSALGLRSLRGGKNGKAATRENRNAARKAHLYPEPRCELGRFLGKRNLATALIDLSDGFSTDLARLCAASRVGACVEAAKIPALFPATPGGLSRDEALGLALNGGEDYELLFTVSPGKVSLVPREFHGVPLHQVGQICRLKQNLLILPAGNKVTLHSAGYDHFRKLD
jgi:thiamine-monophosphate kinase